MMNDDTDKDANLSLIELDKGLKSGNKADQVECVISFADVFNKHPFPIFINSVCLKMSDCFNVSNNFVRLCIVRVLEESHKHLEKIQNVDEFMARIFQVVHSNDPIARAVTIRCLAACAPMLKERKNVHHAVLEALSSNDEVEVEASIHAVIEFSKVSQTFNNGAMETIASKIKTAPVPMKLELISTLQYMDSSQEMTRRAMLICEELLDNYVAHDMVVTVLSTLTNLCCRSLSDISQQLELLFSWLSSDCRQSVQLSALYNLRLLLRASPHHLTSTHVQRLLKYERSTNKMQCKSAVLEILAATVNSLTAHCFTDEWQEHLLHGGNASLLDTLINTFAFDINLQISSLSMKLCSKLIIHLPTEQFKKYEEDVVVGVVSLTLASATQLNLQSLRKSLMCIKRLSQKVDNSQFIDVLLTVLKSTTNDECRLLICEALMTLELPPNIVFHDLLAVLVGCRDSSSQLVVMLCSVILHTCMSYVEMGRSTLSTLSTLVLTSLDHWSLYRVARQGLRFGQYELAVTLLDKLQTQVSAEHSTSFISCLHSFTNSQLCLQQVKVIGDSQSTELDLALLDKAMMSLAEAIRAIETVGKADNFTFHCTYLNLLYTELMQHRRLQCVCNMFWSCPPPALGRVDGARTGDDLLRYGRLTEELRKCSADFHSLYSLYSSLQQSLLDADKETHYHIKVLMERVFFTSQLLDTVLTGERQFAVHTDQPVMEDDMIESIKRLWTCSTSMPESAEISITAQQVSSLKSASLTLMLQNRLPLPRYFFQRLQTTSATINVTPHQKAGEQVLLHTQSYLTLTVEGIVTYANPHAAKRVKKACVSLCCRKQHSSNDPSSDTDKIAAAADTDINLSSTVCLANEYFSTQFLLSFPLSGQHTVKILCQVLDSNDIKWDIGCTAEILVKSFKEKKHSTYMKSST